MQLTVNQPFNLKNTLKCGQGHRWLKDAGNDGWHTAVIGGDTVSIRQVGDVNGAVEFQCAADETRVVAMLRRHFRLDDDVTDIHANLRRCNDRMAALVKCYQGIRVMRVEPWECLAFFILSANKNITNTNNNMESIAAAFNSGAALSGGRYPFPRPCDIAKQGEQGKAKLEGLKLGLKKGTKIYRAADDVYSGKLALNALAEKPFLSETLKELTRLYGVGDKIASCVALFSLEKTDAFPVDTNIYQGLKRWYGSEAGFPAQNKKYLNASRVRKWAQNRFGPYAGYASQFLFIDNLCNSTPPLGDKL